MEKREKVDYARRVFTLLMQQGVDSAFRFPGGGLPPRTIGECLDSLETLCGAMSRERIVDFCICQAHAVYRFGEGYIRKWNIAHSFGKKAIERYLQTTHKQQYWQQRWLQEKGISRQSLEGIVKDRSVHPLAVYIYPQWEDRTKARVSDPATRFYICQMSTLLWTPFSPVCNDCSLQVRCREITHLKYPELLRIRNEAFIKRQSL